MSAIAAAVPHAHRLFWPLELTLAGAAAKPKPRGACGAEQNVHRGGGGGSLFTLRCHTVPIRAVEHSVGCGLWVAAAAMQPEEYPHTPIPPFSPSRTVGSPPASHLSASVLSHVGSLRAPVFSAAGGAALAEGMHAAHHSPLRSSVHPLGLHLPAPTPAWASGLANIALERPSSTVAVPTDSADKPIALSLQSKLHGFQCILDNQAHLIKQLRREVDGKQEVRRNALVCGGEGCVFRMDRWDDVRPSTSPCTQRSSLAQRRRMPQ